MEQGTQAWDAWRMGGLGSSDAPVVMGVSPFTTRRQLWEEKLGLRRREVNEWATQRGHRYEPRARALYEMQNGFVEMRPALVEHAAYPFLRASLDGFSEDRRVVLEIKWVGKDAFAAAREGVVPDKYWPQLQEQLLVTGAERADYYSFVIENEGKPDEHVDGVTVKVYPDMAYCRRLRDELCAFWELIQTRTPPATTARDFKMVRNKEFSAKCRQYAEARARLAELERELLADPLVAKYERWRCTELRVGRFGLPDRPKGDTIFEIVAEGKRDESSRTDRVSSAIHGSDATDLQGEK